jgi:FtsP/CotA-like multicopper oxidase with cupredoxin domain
MQRRAVKHTCHLPTIVAAALAGALASSAVAGELQMPPPIPAIDSVSQLLLMPEIYTMPAATGAGLQVQANAFATGLSTQQMQTIIAGIQAGNPPAPPAPTTSELLVGPTIRAKPGDTLSIQFTNALAYSPGQGDGVMYNDIPHGFDVVNLHTHGLHVSPLGHSDNVLLSLYPGGTPAGVIQGCTQHMGGDAALCQQGTFQYSIKIPAKHPAGTYWYHTHKHGAVALQLSNAAAGALIIEDPVNGIDSLPAVQAAAQNEKVMVFQTISAGTITAGAPEQVTCVGVYGGSCIFYSGQPQPPAPTNVNSQISVNGQLTPNVTMQVGQVQLWRVVNATVSSVIPMCLVPVSSTPGPVPAVYVLAADGVPVQRTVPSPDLPFQLGPPQPTPDGTGAVNNELLLLAAGQRLDVMVQAPVVTGTYQLVQPAPASQATPLPDGFTPPDLQPAMSSLCQPGAVSGGAQVIMTVSVTNDATSGYSNMLPTQTQLNALYTPTSLVGAPDVPSSPTQGVVFGFTSGEYAQSQGFASVVNGRPFTDERPQRTLYLSQMNLWGAQSAADTHMFHVHTNSFQVITRGTTNYAFPIWRDTVLINCAPVVGGGNCAFPQGLTNVSSQTANNYGEVVQFLSRALDFVGEIVMHCHNTVHEDSGMMELVQMLGPPSQGAGVRPDHLHHGGMSGMH